MFYRESLFGATSCLARLPRPDVFTSAFFSSYKEENEKLPCFGKVDGVDGRDWWRRVVKGTYDRVPEIDNEEGLREELEGELFEVVFEDLYANVFTSPEAWQLKPQTLPFLRALKLWNGPKVALISNFDSRLPTVLTNLGVNLNDFEAIIMSGEVGVAKPDKRIFEHAQQLAGVEKSSDCVHLGDNFERDVRGATGAGWASVFIPSDGGVILGYDDQSDGQGGYIEVCDLEGFLQLYDKNTNDEHGVRLLPTTRVLTEHGNNSIEGREYNIMIGDLVD